MIKILKVDLDFKNEAHSTARYLKRMRQKIPESFVRKIPDIWKKLKPCDVIAITNKKIYIWEFKHIRLKRINIDDDVWMQKMLIKTLEPLQSITLNKTSKLEIVSAQIIAYIEVKKCFYHFTYNHAKKS